MLFPHFYPLGCFGSNDRGVVLFLRRGRRATKIALGEIRGLLLLIPIET
jgi:hypothetical protein